MDTYCQLKTASNSKPLGFKEKPRMSCSKTNDPTKDSDKCEKNVYWVWI